MATTIEVDTVITLLLNPKVAVDTLSQIIGPSGIFGRLSRLALQTRDFGEDTQRLVVDRRGT